MQIADELGLPGEQWQIQAVLGALFRKQGNNEQAENASVRAAAILYDLAERIQDEALRSRFLQAPQICRVLKREPIMIG